MNTYIQDTTIPIYITLSYLNGKIPNMIKFPINPESLEKDIPSNSETVNIEGIGEVSIPVTPKLARITIKSFFWASNPDMYTLPAGLYVAWLEKWQKSKKPANLLITRLNYSMQVTCENFKHWVNAGEEADRYFELELQEYRNYGAKKLSTVKNNKLLDNIKKLKDLATIPVLVEFPRPSRNSATGKGNTKIKNPYTTQKNDSLMGITKKITGSSDEWKLLYETNKLKLSGLDTSSLPVGLELTLPQKWVSNSSYNIINTK